VTIVETIPRRITPAIVTLTVIAAVLFGLGWVIGKVSIPLGWMLAACRVGWADARRGGVGL
jgi:hypothetical protein